VLQTQFSFLDVSVQVAGEETARGGGGGEYGDNSGDRKVETLSGCRMRALGGGWGVVRLSRAVENIIRERGESGGGTFWCRAEKPGTLLIKDALAS